MSAYNAALIVVISLGSRKRSFVKAHSTGAIALSDLCISAISATDVKHNQGRLRVIGGRPRTVMPCGLHESPLDVAVPYCEGNSCQHTSLPLGDGTYYMAHTLTVKHVNVSACVVFWSRTT